MSYDKYMKYKHKYLLLRSELRNNRKKNENNMLGGASISSSYKMLSIPINKAQKIKDIVIECQNPKYINADGISMSNIDFSMWTNHICMSLSEQVDTAKMTCDFDIIQKINKNNGPVLVIMAGISTRSFCSTSQVISRNLDKLSSFSKIYMINLNTFKDAQKKSCDERDAIKSSDIPTKFKPEIDFNELSGKIINRVITTLEPSSDNIYLLGKCDGGGIAIHTVIQSDIYKALYLAVPASPINVQPILASPNQYLKKLIYRFSWNEKDPDPVSWGGLSVDQKKFYDAMNGLCYNYESYMFETGKHEVSDEFIDKII